MAYQNGTTTLDLSVEQAEALAYLDDASKEYFAALEECGRTEVPGEIMVAKINEIGQRLMAGLGG